MSLLPLRLNVKCGQGKAALPGFHLETDCSWICERCHIFDRIGRYRFMMDPMLKVPEGRRTHNNVKRALLIGLTILLFMMIFAGFGEFATVVAAPPPH